jgi:aminocarboxymuconate-semialdehyde decarboxylase
MAEPGPDAAPTVDVHTHLFPRELATTFDADASSALPSLTVHADGSGEIMRGGELFRRVSATAWDAERRIERMDQDGVDLQVLSPVPVTLVGAAAPGVAAAWARRQNELLAGIVADRPDRFAALGMVPLQNPDAAVTELEYAVTELGLRGIEIGTEAGGRELDDPRMGAFFAAAESLQTPLFVHPTDGDAIRRRGLPYEFGLGMLTDTALAAAALVFGGVLERFPGLRIALAHGCGTFAWAYPRLVRGAGIGAKPADGHRLAELVRSLWVDAIVFEATHLPLLVERFGAEHVMLGSDFPFYDRRWGSPVEVICGAARTGLISEASAAGMLGSNALGFLRISPTLPT